MRPPARLRRTYFDCRFGQLHVHQAIPPGGGFDEATALVCIPGAAGLGRFFRPLLGPLGADRSIYAPDLPGCGESDAAPAAGASGAGPAENALAILDMLDSLRQRQVDVLTHGSGIYTALSLVAQRPGTLVRRLVFSGAPPEAVAQARGLGRSHAEIALPVAADGTISPNASELQFNDLMGFLAPERSEHKK